jgi:hypothetical protein
MKQKAELDYVNNRQIFTAESGRNIIEIKNENTTIVNEENIKNGQDLSLRLMLV